MLLSYIRFYIIHSNETTKSYGISSGKNIRLHSTCYVEFAGVSLKRLLISSGNIHGTYFNKYNGNLWRKILDGI